MVVDRRLATRLVVVTLLLGPMGLLGPVGCLVAPVVPPLGFVYSATSAPLDHDLQDTRIGNLEGRSSSKTILGLVAWGDASTRAAAEDRAEHAGASERTIEVLLELLAAVTAGRRHTRAECCLCASRAVLSFLASPAGEG